MKKSLFLFFLFGWLTMAQGQKNCIECYTAHFDFTGLEEKYLKSLELGTISPAVYAWWKGYHEEYFQEPFSYYFTQS